MANQNTKVINIARLHPISKIIPTNTKNTVNGKAVADYVEESGGGSNVQIIIENKITERVEQYKQYLLDNFIRGAVVTPSTLPAKEDRKEDFNYFIIPDEGDIPIPPEPELPKPEEVRYTRDISYSEPIIYGSDDGIDYSNVKRVYIELICSTGLVYSTDSINVINNIPSAIQLSLNNNIISKGNTIYDIDKLGVDNKWFNKDEYDLTNYSIEFNNGQLFIVPQYKKHPIPEMILNITIPSNNFELNLYDYVGGNNIDDAIVDWGDGNETIKIDSSTSSLSHIYSNAGDYQLKISGIIKWKGHARAFSISTLSQCLTSINLPTNNSPIADIGFFGFEYFTKLITIPAGLFDNCVLVSSFLDCFSECTSLQSIPEGLFNNCKQATDFTSCFVRCSSLKSIPEYLFNYCIRANNFAFCFRECSSITSNLPKLWVSHPYAAHEHCFENCTNAPNYQDAVDAGWA